MSRDSRPSPIKVSPYTAAARRYRTEQGVKEWYWTARCRRKGLEREWTLGWFVSRRQAETAFTTWVASRTGRRSRRGSPTMAELFEHYDLAIARMATKRKNTRWNRRYTAKQVRDFLDARYPDLLADHFDAAVFEDYLGWLQEQPYTPQTIENALIGARTMFKWAEAGAWICKAPLKPKFRVPPSEVRIITAEEFDKVLVAAGGTDEPIRLPILLRLLWETGMRPSETWGFKKGQIQVGEALLHLRDHGDYTLKTVSSSRIVPLSRDLVMELLAIPKVTDGTIFGVPQVDRPLPLLAAPATACDRRCRFGALHPR